MQFRLTHSLRGCLFGLLVLFVGVLGAQTTVTGTITDAESSDPLIGASVFVTGTTTGTVTDFDGNFTLNVPANSESITISYTGYATQELPLDGRTSFDVQLTSGELLDEVVVVGYGSVKKSDLTGAVVALTEDDFNQGVITSPEELIQGRAAGVQITQTSGEPGAGVNFRIRGTSSVRSNNNPLFVIDGVPLASEDVSATGALAGFGVGAARNPLNFLNPADIASIDVLKDASATAIYGSRGANGVVIITTKSGNAGQGSLEYNTSIGFSGISKRYDLLSADEYLDAYSELNGQDAADLLDNGADTDWQDEIFRTALTQQHSLSFGGGSDMGNYRFSVSYMDQEGIIKESGLQRTTARFNGSRKFINERLTIATQVTVSDINDDNVPISQDAGAGGDLFGAILKSNPTNPVFNDDGSLFQPDDNTEPAPTAIIGFYEGFTNTLRGLANISAELKIIDGLTFKTVYGLDRSTSDRVDAFSPALVFQGNTGVGRLSRSGITVNNSLWENYFNYNRNLGSVSVSGLLGYSYQQFDRSGNFNAFAGFASDDLEVMINNQASGSVASLGNSFRAINELQSYFTRLNLDVLDKYLFTATLRADGSTRFGPDNRYGLFPAFAFKWRLLEEDFIPEAFSTLGLRVGFGVTGNQEFPNNLFLAAQRYSDSEFQSNDGSALDASSLGTIADRNTDLKWESTAQINAGLDFGFRNNRISGSIDYYRKNTNDLIIQIFNAQPAFFPFYFDNLDADIINEGVELALNVVAVDKDNFSWDVSLNGGYNNNVVRNFDGLINTGNINGQGLSGAFAQRIAEGQPLYSFFLRPFGGFDDEGNTIYPQGDRQQFVDASPLPLFTTGLTNTFRMGNLDLNIFLSGQFGHYVYSNTANAFFTTGSLNNGRNVTTDVPGNGEGPLNAPEVSTRFLEKADFVRLQNATLGYTVPVTGNVLSNLRFTVTGQNLFVITGYSGQDPEVSINKSRDGVPSAGIDYSAYPRARTVIFGLNASF